MATEDLKTGAIRTTANGPVPMEHWGKDHWSTLAFAECRAVDYDGKLDEVRMRTDPAVHPVIAEARAAKYGDFINRAHPTVLKGGERLDGHDDWSCVEDMEAAGLVVTGSGGTVVWLTDTGWRIAHELRRWKATGGNFAAFQPSRPQPDAPLTFHGKPINWAHDPNSCDYCKAFVAGLFPINRPKE